MSVVYLVHNGVVYFLDTQQCGCTWYTTRVVYSLDTQRHGVLRGVPGTQWHGVLPGYTTAWCTPWCTWYTMAWCTSWIHNGMVYSVVDTQRHGVLHCVQYTMVHHENTQRCCVHTPRNLTPSHVTTHLSQSEGSILSNLPNCQRNCEISPKIPLPFKEQSC